MLLQFLVENFKSFKDETLLNLAPAKSLRGIDHTLEQTAGKKVKGLPLAALYGANASGKSNLLEAIAFTQRLVTKGTSGEEAIAVTPFRLDAACREKPSRFEFVLTHQNVLYTYGFAVTSKRVEEEYLFAHFTSKESRVFERVTNDSEVVVEAGACLARNKEEKQFVRFVAKGTRPNQLFLTEANERNIDLLKPLMAWFKNSLRIVTPSAPSFQLPERTHDSKEFASFLSKTMQIADIGIKDIVAEEQELDAQKLPGDIPKEVVEKGLRILADGGTDPAAFILSPDGNCYAMRWNQEGNPSLILLKAKYKMLGGNDIDFDLEDESDGTRRLMHLAPGLFDLQTSEVVYIIDELDRSMHPLLCRLYVDAFLKTRGSFGQLVFSTHQTCLLDQELLRRDEVWFVEKDDEGSSHLTSLAEFRVRDDLKVEKGYLHGRFGAIPFLGDPRLLNA